MARNLSSNLENTLPHCSAWTCVTIILANSSVIRVSSGAVVVNSNVFLRLLSNLSALRMTLTKLADSINGTINNNSLSLGQSLIAVQNALDNNYTEIGVCFENLETGQKFYEEKISGEIIASQIDDENISFRFLSDLDAATFFGKTIASEFPDVVVVSPALPAASDDYSDLQNGNDLNAGSIISRKLAQLTDDPSFGRYYLPSELYY